MINGKKKILLIILKKKIKGSLNKDLKSIEAEVNKEIINAFNFAEKSPFPSVAEAYKGVYAQK